MTSNDSKLEKIQTHFRALTSTSNSLNAASDELAKVVGALDEALKKLNIGLTVWVTVSRWADDLRHGEDQIGYAKVSGKWGIALRTFWDDEAVGGPIDEGTWLFNDAPRGLRLSGVDKIPELIEALAKRAFETTKRVQEKTERVRELAGAIGQVASQSPSGVPAAPLNRIPVGPPRSAKKMSLGDLLATPKLGGK
jgi:hypothetical protein